MYTYRIGDAVIGSDIPLAGLPEAEERSPDWRITFGRTSPSVSSPPYHRWYGADGRLTACFVLDPPRRVITFRNGPRFTVDRERRLIECGISRAMELDVVTPLLVHQVLPLALGLDRLVLHASAVRIGDRGIAFVGESGSGKSTLACKLARRGGMMITDDVLIVGTGNEAAMAIPVAAPVRLWPDAVDALTDAHATDLPPVSSRTKKRFVSASVAGIEYCECPVALDVVFVLEVVDAAVPPAISHMTKRDAVAALLARSFSLATDDPVAAGHLLDRIARLVTRASVWRLAVPRNFTGLDSLLDSVLAAA